MYLLTLLFMSWSSIFGTDDYQLGMKHYRQAWAYSQAHNIDKAINHYMIAEQHLSKTDSISKLVSVKKNLGSQFREIGNPHLAIQIYDDAININRDNDAEIWLLYNKARAFRDMKHYNQAFDLLKICYDYTNGTISNRRANVLNEMGLLLVDLNQYEEAREYYFPIVNSAHLLSDSLKYLGRAYHNIADSYFKQHRYQEAINYFLKAMNVKEDTFYIVWSGVDLGESYYQVGDFESAVKTLENCIPYISSINSTSSLLDAYKYLGRSYDSLGLVTQAQVARTNFESAISNHHKVNNELFIEQQRITSLLKYQEFKREITERDKIPVWVWIVMSVLLVTSILMIYINYKKSQHRKDLLKIQAVINAI